MSNVVCFSRVILFHNKAACLKLNIFINRKSFHKMGTSISRMDNRSRYTVTHTIEGGGCSATNTIGPGSNYHCDDGKYTVRHTLRVYDRKSRLIKYLQFRSGNDNQWEIRNHGVILIKQWDHSWFVGTGR